MISSNFSGFPSERQTLENLIVALLKDTSFSLEECMKLILEVTHIPDVLNTGFILNILRGLRKRQAWIEYKKYILLHINCKDAWNDLIDWTVEKGGPSLTDTLDCLVRYKQDNPIAEHGVQILNHFALQVL